MRLIVPDAGAVARALTLDDAVGDTARAATADARWHGPDHLLTEVFNVIRKWVRAGDVPEARAVEALRALTAPDAVALHPFAALWERAWELRRTVTAYDAGYVALAEALDADLVTTDTKLAGANGPTCRITVI